jgi:hypothetical protein
MSFSTSFLRGYLPTELSEGLGEGVKFSNENKTPDRRILSKLKTEPVVPV